MGLKQILPGHGQGGGGTGDPVSDEQLEQIGGVANDAKTLAQAAKTESAAAGAKADAAKTAADGYSTQITSAVSKADAAKTAADAASAAAAAASGKADGVSGTASDAKTKAEAAQSAAATAGTKADAAKTTADGLDSRVTVAENKATAAKTAADAATAAAAAASTKADAAKTAGDNALAVANGYESRLNDVESTQGGYTQLIAEATATANEANTAALNAKQTAENLDDAITAAGTKADTAKTAADAAKVSAAEAKVTAGQALTKATEAKTEADALGVQMDGVINTAETAVTKAEEAKTLATQVGTNVTDIQNDVATLQDDSEQTNVTLDDLSQRMLTAETDIDALQLGGGGTGSGAPFLKNFKVALAGDSIVNNCSYVNSGLRAHGFWGHVNSMLGGVWDFRLENNFGVGGDTTTMLRARYQAVIDSNCGLHVLAIGTNDRGSANMTAQESIDNIRWMIDQSRNSGALVQVVCPRPRGAAGNVNSKNLSAAQLTNHEAVRDWIMSLNEPGVYPTDTWTTLVDPLTEGFIKAGYTTDDLHPNQMGAFYDAKPMAEVLRKISPNRAILPLSSRSSGITVNPQFITSNNGGAAGTAATASFTLTGTHTAGQQLTIGGITYTLVSTNLSVPSVPYEIVRHSTNATMILRFVEAINADKKSLGSGKYYPAGIVAHPDVVASISPTDPNTMVVTARTPGLAGNNIAVSDTLANGAWNTATLTGGAVGDVHYADSWQPTIPAGITVLPEIVETETGRWYQLTVTGNGSAAKEAITLASQDAVLSALVVGNEYEAVCEYEVDPGMTGLQGFQLGLTAKIGTATKTLWDAEHLTEFPSVLPAYDKPRVRRTPPYLITAAPTVGKVSVVAHTIANQPVSAVIRLRAIEAHKIP